MDGSSSTYSGGPGPFSGRLRPRTSQTAEQQPAASVPPAVISTPPDPAERDINGNPEKVLIVKLPIRVPAHLTDFDADAWPYHPAQTREVAPRSWNELMNGNGLTFIEALREAFRAYHPYAASFRATDQFLRTEFTCELFMCNGYINTVDDQRIEVSSRSVERIAHQQDVARQWAARESLRQTLSGAGMRARPGEAEERETGYDEDDSKDLGKM